MLKAAAFATTRAARGSGPVTEPRLVGLDALRVVGALLVFWVHVTPFVLGGDGTEWPSYNGRLGVYVFFALSGYLLTRQLLPGADIGRYLLTRAARILPAYWFAVIGITLLTGTPFAVENPLRYLTMTQAWVAPTYGPLNPTWTLSVEALFYLVLPLLMMVLRQRLGLLAVALASVASLIAIGDSTRMDAAPLMLWAFAPGMAVAWLEQRIRFPRILALPGIALLIGAIAAGSAPLAAIAAALTIAGVRTVTGSAVRLPADLSYAFYLWQVAVIVSLPGIVTGGALLVLSFIGAVAAAVLSWTAIERPVLRWARDRLRRPQPAGLTGTRLGLDQHAAVAQVMDRPQ